MATHEHSINDALAEVLRDSRRSWQDDKIVCSENTSALKGTSTRPDIIIAEPNVSPVVIETEVLPAATVEPDAKARLGERLRANGRAILSSVAVRLPASLRALQGSALRRALETTNGLEMAMFTGREPAAFIRWPASGWMPGRVSDLSILAQFASVPPPVIEEASEVLVNGVSEAADMLGEVARSHPGATGKIGESLRQKDCEQTRRMAMTILANAFVFHHNLARGPGKLADIRTIDEMRGGVGLNKGDILAEWGKVLGVNYWPIFDIARRILEAIPAESCGEILDRMAETSGQLVANRLMHSHDLTGAVFQRLIADRKFLAAYYTTPAASALLSGLAIRQDSLPAGASWSSADDLRGLRVADFACGTGTLLSTAYQRMGQLHELNGGDAEALHPAMMGSVLVGCDILPAATHLTASMLSGAHPTNKYQSCSILTVTYGRQKGDAVSLGSLDLLDSQKRFPYDAITARAAEGAGEKEVGVAFPDDSFDFVIMNPPFVRPTGHEADKIGVHNPMFAAFGLSEDDQRAMGKAAARLAKGTCYNGNAGEASMFLPLADRKLKTGGVLALVMPLSLVSGDAWENARKLLRRGYEDHALVSIAGAKDFETSFSADTGMADCLVVGRKSAPSAKRKPEARCTFVVLSRRPQFPIIGAEVARQLRRLRAGGNIARLEDGPVGGTPVCVGADVEGQALDAPLPASGGWYVSRVIDMSLAQVAYQLAARRRLWLPGTDEEDACAVPMTTLGTVGTMGPYHADINGSTQDGSPRGPFDIEALTPGAAPTDPVLWSHDAERERTMAFEADSQGLPKRGRDAAERDAIARKLRAVRATASHCHLNRDYRFNSQSTGVQFTRRKTVGGRSWFSVVIDKPEWAKAMVLWGNTTFGMLMYWWHANKQQAGRGSIGVKAAPRLPVLDVKALSRDRLAKAAKLFDELCDEPLRPLNEIDRDPVRRELDILFARDILGLGGSITAADGPLDLLRSKLAKEPSVHGGKKSQAAVKAQARAKQAGA